MKEVSSLQKIGGYLESVGLGLGQVEGFWGFVEASGEGVLKD